MKLKNKLSELIEQRNSLVDYSRSSEDPLTMDSLLSLYAEIVRLNVAIKELQDMPLKDGEKEILTYSIEMPSKMNKAYQPGYKIKIKQPKTKKIMPVIHSTWQRAL